MTPACLAARLYLDDPRRHRFEATVVAHGTLEEHTSVLLDQSAFYPESGGQMADHGRLDELAVIDVRLDEQGRVHHLIDGPAPAVGNRVYGHVDEARRREHMALHTGQHILSRALLEITGAETISARLGETACTIDIDRESLADGELGRVEDLATSVIDDALQVRAFFPSEQQLGELALRRTPKVQTQIRVVTIGDFDATPCGGTHCASSAEVGLIHITHTERQRRALRIHFTAGARSRRTLSAAYGQLRSMGQAFSCGVEDVAANVSAALDKLRDQLGESRDTLGRTRGKLARSIAARLVTEHGEHAVVTAELDLESLDLLRAVARVIASAPDGVALLAMPCEDGMHIIATRHAADDFDCGAFIRAVTADGRGRGGGRAHQAEGRLNEPHDWRALVRELGLG
jgi:alanyl-tRNA synthetase